MYAEHRCKCYARIADHPVCEACGILVGPQHIEQRLVKKGVIVHELAPEPVNSNGNLKHFIIIRTIPMRLNLCGFCTKASMSRQLNIHTRSISKDGITRFD